MTRFFDFIVNNKFGILSTLGAHIILFFILNFTYVESPDVEPQGVTEMEIPLEEVSLEDLSQQKKDQQGNVTQSGKIKNTVINKNDDREKSMKNYSRKNMDQKVEKELKSFEKESFEEFKEKNKREKNKGNNYQKKTDKELEEMAKEHLEGGGANKSFAGRALASFDLPGRQEDRIRKPSYTCRGSGTVVIRIQVNKNGQVTQTKYAPELSYKPTACMKKKALAYAKKSTFNYSNQADDPQSGTITYQFISQ